MMYLQDAQFSNQPEKFDSD